MKLAFSTWPEIEDRLGRRSAVVVPIGSNEQHGPTGLLGTDWLCPEIIAHAAEEEGDILVAPTFNIGMAQHHLGFPGTISLRPSTFQAAIADWVNSLVRHGFTRIYFLNGHGSHATPAEIAVTQAAYPDSIKSANIEPRIAPTGPIRDAADYRARFADGRIGSDPLQASPEKGRELIGKAVAALLNEVAEFEAEAQPQT